MKKKFLSVFLVVAMIAAMIPVFGMSASATATTRDTSWYAENEATKTYTITTAGELLGFSDLIAGGTTFGGWTITLGNDIVLNDGWSASATAPTDVWADTTGKTFGGTFDGDGHNVSGIYLSAANGATAVRTGIFGGYGSGATVKNLVLTNSFVEGGQQLGAIFGQAYSGTITVENVYCDAHIKTLGKSGSCTTDYTLVGGLVAQIGSGKAPTVNIKNCVFAGTVEGTNSARVLGGIAGIAVGGTHTIENCAFYGKVMANNIVLGGILARAENAALDLTIKNCISAGIVYYNTDSAYTGAFYGQTTGITSSQIKMSNCYYTQNMYYNGGSTTRHIASASKAVEPTALTDSVAAYSYVDDAALVGTVPAELKDYFTDTENGYPKPTTMVNDLPDGLYDKVIGWYNASGSSFEITTPQQLLGFSQLLAAGNNFSGQTVTLGADIDLNEGWTVGDGVPTNKWADVGAKKFAGTFDGNGYTVTGVYLATAYARAGMFGTVIGTAEAPATVKNLAVLNSYLESPGDHIAGISGKTENATFENLYLDIDVVGNNQYVGGIVNDCYQTVTLKDCVSIGDISGNQKVGGLVGYNHNAAITLDNCAFYGNITVTGNSAGILVGYSYTANTIDIKSCIAGGTFTYGSAESNGTAGRYGAILGSTKTGWVVTAEDTYYVPITVNGETADCPYATAEGYDAKPVDNSGISYKTNNDFVGIDAITPNGFVSMPEGYTMPMGVVNMVAGMKHVNDDTALDGFETAYKGHQKSTTSLDLRLVGLVNVLGTDSSLDKEYTGIGFDVEMITESGKKWNNKLDGELPVITTVYTSVLEEGKDESTSSETLGGDYIFVATVNGIKENVGTLTFVVKTFHDAADGNRVYDDVRVISYDTTVSVAE
ncbi:MAG: hypothetical protein IJ011_01870 [Clostridia bacterium]|nr:hypothetical protein [Clostridia bacterium]